MTASHPGYRIFIIGAGFSKLAGLPLASELFTHVKHSIEMQYGKNTEFNADIDAFVEYRKACQHSVPDKTQIDMEEFMSYLDMEHFLGLRGSKTLSQEGNESQIMVRKAIGEVIHNRTPSADCLPEPYYKFANSLSLNDIVITLNYDILLERALEHVGKPYRLFPDRYKEVGRLGNIIDSDVKEVTVLKLHGSVDWFDNRQFLKTQEFFNKQGVSAHARHSVFSNLNKYGAHPIVDGLRSDNDPLLHIHRITDADLYYKEDTDFHAPLILSPSHIKFVYAEPLLDFWHGLGYAGGCNLGISVVGFSLPKHDEYIRLALYQVISNYQQLSWNEPLLNNLKDYVRLVDFREGQDSISEYIARYSFVDESRAKFMFSGFEDKAIDFLFNEGRKIKL